jgi:hypothetical protein
MIPLDADVKILKNESALFPSEVAIFIPVDKHNRILHFTESHRYNKNNNCGRYAGKLEWSLEKSLINIDFSGTGMEILNATGKGFTTGRLSDTDFNIARGEVLLGSCFLSIPERIPPEFALLLEVTLY